MITTTALNLAVRLAHPSDIPELTQLIQDAARGLMAKDYTARQIESALIHLLGVDSRLIEDGTYFVAEVDGEIAGAGGWSRRKSIYGHDATPRDDADLFLDPISDAARIRAFFVHPHYARQGIARHLLHISESAARANGFWKLELVATWTGVPVYESCGYIAVEDVQVALPDGEIISGLHMMKILY